jgi:dihydrofolate reductase
MKNIKYIAIAAMAKNRIIGNEWKIPWHIPEDFRHFRETTAGHPIIMGRKTFESIGRVLPWRENIVLTRGDFSFPGLTVMRSIDELEEYLSQKSDSQEQNPPNPLSQVGIQVYICWGSQIYEEFFRLGKTDEVSLSVVDIVPEGDVAFPYFEEDFTKVSEDKREGFTIEHWIRWDHPHMNPHE